MKKIKFIFPLVFFIVLIIFFWHGIKLDTHKPAPSLVGKSVPEFSIPSLFDSKKILNRDIFYRHISVVNIFTSQCISCDAEHPLLMKLHQKNKSIQMIGIAFKDKRSNVEKYLKKQGNPFDRVIEDRNGVLCMALGISSAPETFIVDQRGVIRSQIKGPVSAEILKNELLPLTEKLKKAW